MFSHMLAYVGYRRRQLLITAGEGSPRTVPTTEECDPQLHPPVISRERCGVERLHDHLKQIDTCIRDYFVFYDRIS